MTEGITIKVAEGQAFVEKMKKLNFRSRRMDSTERCSTP
jgi:hypothetical protein